MVNRRLPDCLPCASSGAGRQHSASRTTCDAAITADRIPRIIHQMDFLPSRYRNPLLALTGHTSRLHQDWCVHYWSDEEMGLAVNSMPNDISSTYPLLNMGVMRADTARLAIMFAYGGWYLDTDILCTRPVSELVAPGEELVLVEQPSTAMHGGGVANFLMGSAPKHPLWNATLTHIAQHATSQLHGLLAKNASHRQVLAITGSQAITHAKAAYFQDRPLSHTYLPIYLPMPGDHTRVAPALAARPCRHARDAAGRAGATLAAAPGGTLRQNWRRAAQGGGIPAAWGVVAADAGVLPPKYVLVGPGVAARRKRAEAAHALLARRDARGCGAS